MDKVFCSECKHFRTRRTACGKRITTCCHRLNVKVVDDWEMRQLIPIQPPDILNKHNNCCWFEERYEKSNSHGSYPGPGGRV